MIISMIHIRGPILPDRLIPEQNMEVVLQHAVEEETDLSGLFFANGTAPQEMRVISLKECRFSGCRFNGCKGNQLYFLNIQFESCDFSSAIFDRCLFRRVRFVNCKLFGTIFTDTSFEQCVFENSPGRLLSLSRARCKEVLFSGCDLSNANLQESKLTKTYFENCRLRSAELLHTPLKGIDFTSDDLEGVSVTIPELRGAIVTREQACDLAKLLGIVIQ